MSYYKIYDAFSIKQGDKLIPCVIIGESNVIDEDPYTHKRRIANWPQLAHWLYSRENRNEVEIKDKKDLERLLLYPSLIEEYKGGDIQGISLNAIIKRMLNNIIDNDVLHVHTEIGDLHHSGLTEEQIKRLEETRRRYNNQINRILLKDERIALYNNFVKEFDDDPKIQKEIKDNYDNYLEGFFEDYIDKEALQEELRKLKIARLMKKYNKRHQISEQSDKGRLYA
ncbi:MAG: hypothetical protein QXN16_00675 [Candidatus Micrarchaeaceae archaeon]